MASNILLVTWKTCESICGDFPVFIEEFMLLLWVEGIYVKPFKNSMDEVLMFHGKFTVWIHKVSTQLQPIFISKRHSDTLKSLCWQKTSMTAHSIWKHVNILEIFYHVIGTLVTHLHPFWPLNNTNGVEITPINQHFFYFYRLLHHVITYTPCALKSE